MRLAPMAHGGDIDVPVAHAHEAEVLLGVALAAAGELGHRPDRGGLGGLAARVGVELGVEDQDVDVAAGGHHVVEAAEADVVGPAVAADDPDALVDEIVLQLLDFGQEGLELGGGLS